MVPFCCVQQARACAQVCCTCQSLLGSNIVSVSGSLKMLGAHSKISEVLFASWICSMENWSSLYHSCIFEPILNSFYLSNHASMVWMCMYSTSCSVMDWSPIQGVLGPWTQCFLRNVSGSNQPCPGHCSY